MREPVLKVEEFVFTLHLIDAVGDDGDKVLVLIKGIALTVAFYLVLK